MPANGKVTVFGPHPMLAITVEALTSEGGDDIHLHAAGQGVWVARMAAELGAGPTLCGFIGGESGAVLRPLLEQMEVEMRLVETAEASGAYLHDRRSGERVPIAQSASMPPSRHEIDELFSTTVTAALDSGVLAVCGPYPGEALPLEIYGNLVADVKANGTPVVVDLSRPRLDTRSRRSSAAAASSIGSSSAPVEPPSRGPVASATACRGRRSSCSASLRALRRRPARKVCAATAAAIERTAGQPATIWASSVIRRSSGSRSPSS